MNKKHHWLLDFSSNVTSQDGEDGIIEKINDLIASKVPTSDHWCVELGAWDGKKYSNTWNLLNKKSWSGVLIEANKEKFKSLNKNYEQFPAVQCINSYVEFEGDNTLDNLLRSTSIPKDFDLLSVDIDGNDYHLWDSLQKYNPKIIVIEYNPTIPNDIEFIQEKNHAINHGNSAFAIVNLGVKKGYQLVAVTNTNLLFVKNDLFSLFEIEKNSLDELRPINRFATRLFQLYDGTLVLHGYDMLCWQGIKINQEDIQVLPREKRVFSDKQEKSEEGNNKSFISKIISRIK